METKPIERAEFRAGDLVKGFPPRWHDRNKKVVFEIAGSSAVPFEGQVVYARWAEEQPPSVVAARRRFSIRSGGYDYAD